MLLGSKSHILGFSGKSRSLRGITNGSCFLRYLTLFRNTGWLSRPFVSPCQQGASVEELQCSGRTTAVSEATQRAHVSLYMILEWENCRKRYNSLTEIRGCWENFAIFVCHEVAHMKNHFPWQQSLSHKVEPVYSGTEPFCQMGINTPIAESPCCMCIRCECPR